MTTVWNYDTEAMPIDRAALLASYYLFSFPSSQNNALVPSLARYDVVILDMEMGVTNPTAISGIRQINPNVVILAYMTSQQISDTQPSQSDSPLQHSNS